ncbi:MAG: DNA ligase, partial [Candidatus Omnitrophica bacterium]|nr:DNA ligase [Candidatus Omnitrophota bacterium]
MKFKNLAGYFQKLESTTKRLEMSAILAELFKPVGEQKTEEIAVIVYLCQGQLLPAFKNIEFGISEKLIHKALVEATGVSSAEIEALFQQCGDYGEVAQKLCLTHTQEPKVMSVYADLEKLAAFSGEGAVGKKVEFLAGLLNKVSSLEARYILRIILGKLRLGVGDPTVLDGLSLAFGGDTALRAPLERAYNLCSDLGLVATILFSKGIRAIENFKVIVGCPIRMALAARLSGPREIIEKVGTCAIEAKYDGFRCQVHKKGDQVHIFSRNLENTTAMFPEIREGTLRQIKEKNVIFE